MSAWTEAEVATLRRLYPYAGSAQTARSLPGRTAHAVSNKAGALGLRLAPVLRAKRRAAP